MDTLSLVLKCVSIVLMFFTAIYTVMNHRKARLSLTSHSKWTRPCLQTKPIDFVEKDYLIQIVAVTLILLKIY